MDCLPEIECPDLNQIKSYCQEALERSDEYGVDDGLSFLIGKKFYEVFRQLREEQNRIRFFYDESDDSIGRAFEDKALKMNYASTVNGSYRSIMERIKRLETARDQFIIEIADSFDDNDIKEYLAGYPRLGVDPEFHAQSEGTQVASFSANEVLSEALEILCVDDITRLFF